VSKLDYRETFFYRISESFWGYKPWIEIKPAHLANGFFRAICGVYSNNPVQHKAVYPKYFANLREIPEFQSASTSQKNALDFFENRDEEREMLYLLLNADGTVFRGVNTSSYTLSHTSHITTDNHDRDAGIWLYRILTNGGISLAVELLNELLQQDDSHRSDELSVLTLPLDEPTKRKKSRLYENWSPASLNVDRTGKFCDPLIDTIRCAFDQLAQNQAEAAKHAGKLDTLRQFVMLGCFAIYLHLANSGVDNRQERIPMLLTFGQPKPTLRQASIRSYQLMLRSIDDFLRSKLKEVVDKLAETEEYGPWATDQDIKRHIEETINWFRLESDKGREKEKPKVESFRQDCLRFYHSYRSEAAKYSPSEAFSNAATDMLGLVLSSKPQAIARALGTRIGLLNPGRDKRYMPQPDLLEVLVKASIPKGETWTLVELATCWADEYGILFGALGDEDTRLAKWGIPAIDRNELISNVTEFGILLEMIGYARRYADGVVLVKVEE
jgi:hypothetical protein